MSSADDVDYVELFEQFGEYLTPIQREDFRVCLADQEMTQSERAGERDVSRATISANLANARERLEEIADDKSVAADGGADENAGPPKPEAPESLPKYLVDGVEKQSPATLRELADYAERVASWKEAKAERELQESAEQAVDTTPDEWDAEEWEDVVDDARDEADLAPGKGTLTTKTIDGRDYYYLQWRAGSKIKSQYVAPVTPASNEN